MTQNNPLPLITIEGPTATGKSIVASRTAKMLQTDIISADSRQIYRYMDIGTSKPTKEIQQEVPHHLIDIIDPDEEYSAGRFAEDARKLIQEMLDTHQGLHDNHIDHNSRMINNIPIVTGGTGFYVQSLIEGLFEAPSVNEEIRKELDAFELDKGSDYLYAILEKIDPDAANKIHPNDSYRLKRALEVWIATGKGISTHWAEQKEEERRFNPFRILLTGDRDELYRRINLRLDKMIEEGLIEEIKSLMEMGYTASDPGLTSVGYKEFIPFICGDSSFFKCLDEAKKNTRNYAKRQITWYRRIRFNLTLDMNDNNIDQIAAAIKNYFES